MAEDSPGWAPLPVAGAVALWLAAPDVLADPFQVGEHGVWTRAADVLPGARVQPGRPVVAAWGDLAWIGMPTDETVDAELLWLRPLTGPVQVPDLRAAYSATSLAAAVHARLQATPAGATARPTRPDAALLAALEEVLEPVLADLGCAVSLFVTAVRHDRATAQAVLREISELPRPHARRLLRSTAGVALHRLARRARPPRRRAPR